MPAKKEYLSSTSQRWLKITAGILGGYLLSSAFHLLLASFIENKAAAIITSAYTIFICWVVLMIMAFRFRNGWTAWGTYLAGIVICGLGIYIRLL